MDLGIDAYEKLIEAYKTTKETAGKVNQIFSQGKADFSDPEYEAIVAGFMENHAIEGLFERVKLDELGLKVLPTDRKSLAIALLTKRGYDIVATDKDLAGEVMDVVARKDGTVDVVVMKCGPATVKKVIGYLERSNTMMWILDQQYRLFMFKRGPNWDSFMSYHKEQQEASHEPEPEPEEPEIKPLESYETQTPAEVIAEAEREQKKPVPEPEIRVEDEPETPSEPEPAPPEEEPSHDEDDTEDEEERSRRGAVFTIGNRKLPRILKKEDVAQMIKISKPIPRDTILIQCMYFLGMTNGEVQNLKVEDIDFANNKVRVSEGKNRRDRILPIPAELARELKSYIGARSEGYLIRGRDKKAKRISDRHIRRLVKAYAKEADVRNWEGIHPHTLRHSYATHLLDEGTPIETVQNVLGHERLETTAIYSHARNTRELQEHVNGAIGN